MSKKGAYINDDGILVVDMAEADKLWNSLSMEQQYNAMCGMFDPLLAQAAKMRVALETIEALDPAHDSAKIARAALPK
ncbi:MAG: hypothetical protein AB3N13_12155 [Arenibacterium sp.]